MKPSFALVLTQDTIGLLHRTSQGWQPVGEAAVSDPDLTEALGFLRRSALGLEPRGVTTKLVIPNSEVLYLTLRAPGPSAAARKSQIKAALEGRTPYAVSDLVFDWSGSGPEVQVAVVARETLQEAEAFASQHRLGPLSFVGSPDVSLFSGEPWFGPAAGAASLLPPGEKVERDQSPVPVAATPRQPDAPEAEPAAPPVAAADSAVVRAPEPDALPAAPVEPVRSEPIEARADHAPAPVPQPPETPAVPVDEPIAEPARIAVELVEPVAPSGDEVEPVRAKAPDAAMEPPPPMLADPVPPPLARAARADVIAPSLEVQPDEPKAKAATGSTAPAVERLKARLAEQPIDQRRFGNRPSGLAATPPAPAPALSADKAGNAPQAAPRTLKAVPGPAAPPRPVAAAAARPAAAARVAAKGAARGAVSMVTSPSIPMPRDRRVNIPVPDAAAEARTKTGAEGRKSVATDAEGLTAFGAKKARRGKPRYLGLILTGVLLILLAVIAAWSSFFVASNEQTKAVPVAAAPAAPDTALPVTPATAVATADQPATDVPPQPPAPETAEVGDATVAAPPSETAQADVAPAGVQPTAAVTVATSNSPADAPAPVTESAVVPQPDVAARVERSPADEPQDEIFLASTDPTVPVSPVVALAPPKAPADPPPASQPLPPPFGTVYQFDANGMILPTPEGIVTPEGVRLVSGKPPIVPPERPASPETQAAAPTPAPAEPATVLPASAAPVSASAAPSPLPTVMAAPGGPAPSASVAGVLAPAPEGAAAAPVVGADPALAAARPRARPAGVAPADPAPLPAAQVDGALPQPSDTQLTSLRPRARPEAMLAQGEALQTAKETAAAQSASASLAATAANADQTSPLAVAVSRKPAPRPQDFGKSDAVTVVAVAPQPVAEAAAATLAMAAPEPRPEPAPRALPQPDPKPVPEAKATDDPAHVEVDEPEVTSAAPSLPTRANVAKQATFRNAINLSRINLIGVYGSDSNRYALVRQANGRYTKVGVGDRVDGGQVAEISERELRYVKNGRTVTLAMPKS